jgi:hypothetical protein
MAATAFRPMTYLDTSHAEKTYLIGVDLGTSSTKSRFTGRMARWSQMPR